MLLTTYTTGPSKQWPDIPLTAAIGAGYHLVIYNLEKLFDYMYVISAVWGTTFFNFYPALIWGQHWISIPYISMINHLFEPSLPFWLFESIFENSSHLPPHTTDPHIPLTPHISLTTHTTGPTYEWPYHWPPHTTNPPHRNHWRG